MNRGSKQQPFVSYPPPKPTTRPYTQNPGVGRKFDLIPEGRNYGFEDVYYGKFGENTVLAPGNDRLRAIQEVGGAAPLFVKVDNLEAAKRKATNSFSKLCSATDHAAIPGLASAATKDQQDVLRHRIDVLNALIIDPNSHICVKHKLLQKPDAPKTLVSVTYNRYVRESLQSDREMGEIQSPMAWVVPGAQKFVAQLLDTGDDMAGKGHAFSMLLYGLRKSIPSKYCTKKLRKSLIPQFPNVVTRIQDHALPSTRDQQHYQPSALTSHHTAVYEATTELRPSKKKPDAQPEKVTFRVITGVLDLNVLEQWQNPSTNARVRKSIIRAGVEHQPHPGAGLDNVHALHIKITRGMETHVLSFRPFIGDEACTVSHLTFTEEAAGAGDKGILRLNDDPETVHGMHGGVIHAIESYVCLGAHRENRYNEAQLNYIHSRGYIHAQLVGEGRGLPDPHAIAWDSEFPPAKATRISDKDCDVMASSYHVGGKVHTVVSVVNYPSFGTQFTVRLRLSKKDKVKAKAKRAEKIEKLRQSGKLVPRALAPRRPRRAGAAPPPPMPRGEAHLTTDGGRTPTDNKRTRTTAPGFTKGRVYSLDDTGAAPYDKNSRLYLLERGQGKDHVYFLDGVVFDPYDKDSRLYLLETGKGKGAETREAMAQALKIREDLIAECKYTGAAGEERTIWNPDASFYKNLRENQTVHPVSLLTARDIWHKKWKQYMGGWVKDNWNKSKASPTARGTNYTGDAFWFCKNPAVWADLLDNEAVRASYCKWAQEKLAEGVSSSRISMRFVSDHGLQAMIPPQIIPRPPLAARPVSNGGLKKEQAEQKELSHLQARVLSLESRLKSTQRDGNAASLMQEVLRKLRQNS